MTKRYMTEDGKSCNKNDNLRAVWYSPCGYWTDRWDILETINGGVPVCPDCHTPGFITDMEKWFSGAKMYEDEGNPRYVEFILTTREICNKGFIYFYKKWLEKQKDNVNETFEESAKICAEENKEVLNRLSKK